MEKNSWKVILKNQRKKQENVEIVIETLGGKNLMSAGLLKSLVLFSVWGFFYQIF